MLREFAEQQMAYGRSPVPVVLDPAIRGGGVHMDSSKRPTIRLSERAYEELVGRLAGDERESDLFKLVGEEKGKPDGPKEED